MKLKRYLVFFTRPCIEATELSVEKGKMKPEKALKYYSYVDAESLARVKDFCAKEDTINYIFECPTDTKFIEVMSEEQFRIKCRKAKIKPSIANWNAYVDLAWEVTMIEFGKETERIPLTLTNHTPSDIIK